jgi:hypothetical protein
MSAASDYLEQAVLAAITGRATFPAIGFTYIALHTAAPSEANGLPTEVQTAVWPSYTRIKVEGAGAIGTGWSDATPNGSIYESKNLNAVTFPSNNGGSTVRVTHWSMWDSLTGGNMKVLKDLVVPVDITPGDIFVFDVNALTLTAA